MLDSFRRPDAPPLSFKTDAELRYIIDNREKYLPESVLGAVTELQNRGHELSEEEIRVVQEDMKARVEIANTGPGYNGVFADNYKDCLVEDPDAYQFYSRRVIKVFTFFSVFFGSILMAMNIAKTKNQGGVFLVILFGIVVTVVEDVIAFSFQIGAFAFVLGIINILMMDALFWNRFIGKTTLYKARKYWVPLIIWLVLFGIVIITLIKNGGAMPGYPAK